MEKENERIENKNVFFMSVSCVCVSSWEGKNVRHPNLERISIIKKEYKKSPLQ